VSISNSADALSHEDIVDLGVFYYVSKYLMSNLSARITFLAFSLLANCAQSGILLSISFLGLGFDFDFGSDFAFSDVGF
jgi:hypothetical protein